MAYSSIIQNLIDKLMALPSVGPKTAEQYAFAIKELSAKDRQELAQTIAQLQKLVLCGLCAKICVKTVETKLGILCEICSDKNRDKSLLMVIESEPDLDSIEKANRYTGLYFIIGEVSEARIKNLIKRIRIPEFEPKELILSFDLTPQNELSLFEIKQALKKATLADLTISRLGRGLPTGADLRYLDTQTILGALSHRERV